MKYRYIAILLLLLISTGGSAQWNGSGVIQNMFIYPTYAVIVQGKVTTGPNTTCANDGTWSFEWSQFDPLAQNRIQSVLLTAYASKTPIEIGVDATGCGPENKKKFNGMFAL